MGDTRVFEIDPNIEMKKMVFKNRYGIELAGDLYFPKDYQGKKNLLLPFPAHLVR